MIQITYPALVLLISALWVLVRGLVCSKTKPFRWQRELDSHKKVIAAGVGFSACIEILQLPFDRVTDIDDLILNSLGFLLGYGIYLLCKKK